MALNWSAFAVACIALVSLIVTVFVQKVFADRTAEKIALVWEPDDERVRELRKTYISGLIQYDSDRIQLIVVMATLLPGALFVPELLPGIRILLVVIFASVLVAIVLLRSPATPKHRVLGPQTIVTGVVLIVLAIVALFVPVFEAAPK